MTPEEILKKIFSVVEAPTPPAKARFTGGNPLTARSKIEPIETFLSTRAHLPRLEFVNDSSAIPRYHFNEDRIFMRDISTFKTRGLYYHFLFHELAHSTAHESRLKRKRVTRFLLKQLATEELIAELCALFLMDHFGLISEKRLINSGRYIRTFFEGFTLTPEKKLDALTHAQKALEYLLHDQSVEPARMLDKTGT